MVQKMNQLSVMKRIKKQNVPIIVYEPEFNGANFQGSEVIKDLTEFKQRADLIIANRISENLHDVMHKVYSRDLKGSDI